MAYSDQWKTTTPKAQTGQYSSQWQQKAMKPQNYGAGTNWSFPGPQQTAQPGQSVAYNTSPNYGLMNPSGGVTQTPGYGGNAQGGGSWASSPSGWWNGGQTVFPWGSGSPNYTSLYGNAPGGATEAQSWMNTMLPWYQQAQQQQQFGSQMEQNKWAQEGAWGISREQMAQEAQLAANQEAYQRWYAQGGWQQVEAQRAQEAQLTQGGWAQEMARLQAQLSQEKQLTEGGWQQQLLRQTQGEQATAQNVAMQTFGRRWMPNTRWM